MTLLDQWLSDATRGLSAESAARVRSEIQQHYDSACEAGDDAIAALGNPRAANRAYRKVLLTEYDATMAPVLTKPKRPGISEILPFPAMLAAFCWLMSRKQHGPVIWPIAIAICCTTPLTWFFSPTTLERSRTYASILGVRDILVAAIAWWYNGWIFGLTFGAIFFLPDYFFHRHRLLIFRKLVAGQTWSLLPGEPRLTHVEAITLRTLDRGDPYENVMGTVVVLMVVGMTVWLPATFGPMAVFVVAGHLTRQTIPFRTEEGSRWFRVAKWTAMAVAALLPVLLRASVPWDGAFVLAVLFVLFDLRSISLRRKLPVERWPKKLYW